MKIKHSNDCAHEVCVRVVRQFSGRPGKSFGLPPVEEDWRYPSVTKTLRKEIGSRVGRNQATVMQICERRMQEGMTDQRGRAHPPQCTTPRENRQIVRMAVKDHSVTSRTVAQHIVCNASFSVCAFHSTSFTAQLSVRKMSIFWSTLDVGPQMSLPPMVR
ncbi:uncharacterized protein TNCV_3374791 [Trichonephila clavipes]|nr:uncharacterized protein TNCV_3374791 [Trichonephila clavipes]